jgi:Transposase
MTQYAAYLGIDWVDKKHDLCLVDTASGKQTKLVLPHTPQAIAAYFTKLRAQYPGQLIAVGLEQSRGPLLFALLQYDFLVLYPLNPTTLAKYREAFTPSRAKDDPTDADYAAELLMKHSDRLKAWYPDDDETRTLRYLVEHRRRLIGDRTRFYEPHDLVAEMLFSSRIVLVSRSRHGAGVRLSQALASARTTTRGEAHYALKLLSRPSLGAPGHQREKTRSDQSECAADYRPGHHRLFRVDDQGAGGAAADHHHGGQTTG